MRILYNGRKNDRSSVNCQPIMHLKKNFWIIILIVLNVLIIGFLLIRFLNRTYPIIGHDYRLFMPYMLDSYLHQKINGLTIQWYTPSFTGGRPVFPNPEDLQFSLPQFLMWLFDPWTAILVSITIFIAIGFTATYYFLKKLVGLGSFASILGAVFFIANGFYFEHMAVGHITFQAFPLFAVVAIIFIHPRLPAWLGGLLLSLIVTILLYSGIHNIPFFILAGMLLFPILYLIKPALLNWKRMAAIALWGGIATALLCGSKISAIIYLMRFFPRLAQDNYTTTLLTGMVGMVRQLLGSMTLTPIYRALHFVSPRISTTQAVIDMVHASGSTNGYWELDASLSPALLLLLTGGAVAFLFRRPNLKAPINKKRLIAIACLIFATWIVIEFTLAKGLIYPRIRDLPILASVRGNVRNICAFIFPLAVIGAVIFDRWTRNWRSKGKVLATFLLLDGIALAALLTFGWVPHIYELDQIWAPFDMYLCDYRPILATYNQIRYEGKTFPIEVVIPKASPWEVFQDQATNLIDPENVIFGRLNGYRETLHAGSVYDVNNGYFNMINPTGYLFPEVNHSSMFEKIPVTDKAEMEAFVTRHQPDWKLPVLQQVLDWVASISLIGEFGLVAFYLIRNRILKRKA